MCSRPKPLKSSGVFAAAVAQDSFLRVLDWAAQQNTPDTFFPDPIARPSPSPTSSSPTVLQCSRACKAACACDLHSAKPEMCACLTQRPGQSATEVDGPGPQHLAPGQPATELDGLGPQHLALAAQALLFLHRRDALLVLAMAVVRSRTTEVLPCSSQPWRRLQTGGLCMAFFLGRSPAAFRLHGMSPSPSEPGPWLRARSSGCVAGPGGLCAT